jgi:hypothetical protein
VDITSYNDFVVSWTESGDNITMVFKDSTETTTLGEITIQANRMNSFFNSLTEVAYFFSKQSDTQVTCTTTFTDNTSRGSFNA